MCPPAGVITSNGVAKGIPFSNDLYKEIRMHRAPYTLNRPFPKVPIEHVYWPLHELDHPAQSSEHQNQPIELRMSWSGINDSFKNLMTNWGSLLTVIDSCRVPCNGLLQPDALFSPWVFGKDEDFFNYVTMLIFDYPEVFDVPKKLPLLGYFERAEYMARDLHTGDEVFRVIVPIKQDSEHRLWYDRFSKLIYTIRALANGSGSQPKSIGNLFDRSRNFLVGPSSEEAPVLVRSGQLLTVPLLEKLDDLLPLLWET